MEGIVRDDRKTMDARGLRFDVVEHDRKWRISFVGGMERTTERKAKKSHVELSLEFNALNDMFDFGSCVPQGQNRDPLWTSLEHREQAGRFEGRLSTGLDDFAIDALGGCSQSRNPPEQDRVKNWTRLSCRFSENHAFSLSRLGTDDGTVEAGFVFRECRNIPVVKSDLNIYADFAKNPKSFDMILYDSEGGTHKVFGSVIRRVRTHLKSPDGALLATLNETLTRYTTGGSNGYGVAAFQTGTD